MTCGAPSHEPEYVAEYHRRPYVVAKMVERSEKDRLRKRAFVRAHKLATGCADCGYRDRAEALHLDHVAGDKEFNIGGGGMVGWARLHTEMAKCEVVCANCHATRTSDRRGNSG